MDETAWFWSRGGEQSGPSTTAELRNLIAAGQLTGEHLVWNEQMRQWARLGDVPTLSAMLESPTAPSGTSRAPSAAATTLGFAAAPAGAVEYFGPGVGLPPHAAAALRGHARPTGDVGSWPLNEVQLQQLTAAKKSRAPITNAVSLFRVLFLLTVIAAVVSCCVGLGMMASGGRRAQAGMIGTGVFATICAAMCVLYYFAWRGTQRSQGWAPLTMGIVFAASLAINAAGLGARAALANSSQNGDDDLLIGSMVGILFGGLFTYIAIRAFFAIRSYRRQPAWCQELLATMET
jgi:hypothetical protein